MIEPSFTNYDHFLAKHFKVSLAPDIRSEQQADSRRKRGPDLEPIRIPGEEFQLEGTFHDIVVQRCGETGDVQIVLDGRRAYGLWCGDQEVAPEVLTRRGYVPMHDLRVGDWIQGCPYSVLPDDHLPEKPAEHYAAVPRAPEPAPATTPVPSVWFWFLAGLTIGVLATLVFKG